MLVDIGFLSDEEQPDLKENIPWKEATQKVLKATSSKSLDLEWAIKSKTQFKDKYFFPYPGYPWKGQC